MKKILVIDCYDSFTYNLVEYVRNFSDVEIKVVRNDEIDFDIVPDYEYLILSPGPGIPSESTDLLKVISAFGDKKKVLGVCLGMQAIAEAYGGKLINLNEVYHGVAMKVRTKGKDPIYTGLPGEFLAGRYHSWAIDNDNLPHDFEVSAVDENGIIMSIRHKAYPVHGVQFHPESILTSCGKEIIHNFLNI